MKISWYTNPGDLQLNNGYGVSGYNIVTSLQAIGHTIPYNDPDCQAQINFCWPTWFEDVLRPHQYNIGYTPWESTHLPPRWKEIFNQCDEVWTTSDWVKQVYENAGVEKPIYVYEHGINEEWKPFKRKPNNVLRFLHHGEPAPRKGGQMAYEAFKAAFGDSQDVQLTIKANKVSTIRSGKGITFGEPGGNVRVIKSLYSLEDLVGLYWNHHAMIYPSYGEGFGLIPLQALATGMPVVSPKVWAPYREFINYGLDTTPIDSPWPEIHPGQVYEPSFDDLVDAYRHVYKNYDSYSKEAFANSFKVHDRYNWQSLTKKAVQPLVERFS